MHNDCYISSFFIYLVYCTGLLGSNAFGLLRTLSHDLLFYISVCRLAALVNLDVFVACKLKFIILVLSCSFTDPMFMFIIQIERDFKKIVH